MGITIQETKNVKRKQHLLPFESEPLVSRKEAKWILIRGPPLQDKQRVREVTRIFIKYSESIKTPKDLKFSSAKVAEVLQYYMRIATSEGNVSE